MISPPRIFSFICCLFAILLSSCTSGNQGGEVSGTVTIDGEPVTAGEVLFISEDGKWSASSPLTAEGTFIVKEPPVGIVKIAVQTEAFRPSDPEVAAGTKKSKPNPFMVPPDPKISGTAYKQIPSKYEKVDTSGLTLDVKRGKVRHPIELTTKE